MRVAAIIIVTMFLLAGCGRSEDIVRPEPILSKRKVVYEQERYAELAELWKTYYKAFPSEDAYANWMYAARYAGDEEYESLLDQGRKKYPANPMLLYLAGLLKHGAVDDQEGLAYLERAAMLAPEYDDPWFALVTVYMERQDDEKLNLALRKLLSAGAIAEEVMDYNYNVLATLDSNAIIFSNGDNDTYPVWVLQNILGYRQDVTLVNRSLLNTEWYPSYMLEHGLPRFMTSGEIKEFREQRMQDLKKEGGAIPGGGPYGDAFMLKITDAAERLKRPVYFAPTLYITEELKPLKEKGAMQAMAIRVAPAEVSNEETAAAMRHWLAEYRTAGLDSWSLRYANSSDAGKLIITNYGQGLLESLEVIKESAPELRGELFEWYLKHLSFVMPVQYREAFDRAWCEHSDIPLVKEWCRSQGIE